MERRIISTATAAVLALNMCAALPCAVSADEAVEGIVMNIDAEDYLAAVGTNLPTVAEIKAYATAFGGSHVTDFVIGVNNKIAAFPSDVWTDYLDKYDQTTENGQAVNYKETPSVKGAYHIYKTLNADYIDLWIDGFNEVDINPWLSFAMNDVTDGDKAASHLLSDYFHENSALRRVHLSRTNNKYQYALDYNNASVRNNMLNLIDEALGKYDAYGIELDFMDSIWLFSNGTEYNGMEKLNDFMREVDKITAKYAAKYKHEVKVSVRVASDIMTNYDFGLDVATWASEGLVDRVCPSGASVVDSDIPVKYWDTLLTPYGIDVAPCINSTIKNREESPISGTHDLETLSGYAGIFLSQGADKVYLADFGIADRIRSADKTATVADTDPINTTKALWNAVNVVGSYNEIMKTDRRVILTYSDTRQLWRNSDAQLPKSLPKAGALMINAGDIPEGANVTFKFSVSEVMHTQGISVPQVYINAVNCKMTGFTEGIAGGYTTNHVVNYEVPAEVHDEGHFLAEIKPKASTNNALQIIYAEVYIDAK